MLDNSALHTVHSHMHVCLCAHSLSLQSMRTSMSGSRPDSIYLNSYMLILLNTVYSSFTIDVLEIPGCIDGALLTRMFLVELLVTYAFRL